MSEILNVAKVHNTGKAEITVGLRGNEFKLQLSTADNTVSLFNPITGQMLRFNVGEILVNGKPITDKYAELRAKPTQTAIAYIKPDGTLEAGFTKAELDKTFEDLNRDIENKADRSFSIHGYGIEDAYTKKEIDAKLDELRALINELNNQKMIYGE